MRIYQDIFTKCEIISDSYPWTLLYEDTVAEVKSVMKVKGQIVVDAFGVKTGEVQEEGGKAQADQNVQKYNDILQAFKYQETNFVDKKEWLTYFKVFTRQLLQTVYDGRSEDEVAKFKKGSGEFVKFINFRFNEIIFYTPQNQDIENSLIYALYVNAEDEAPHFYYFLPGMKFYEL